MPNRAHYTFSISDRFSGPARRIRQATLRIRNSMGKLERKSITTSMALGGVANRLKQFGALAAGAGIVMAVKQFGNLQAGVSSVLTLLDDQADAPKFRAQMKGAAEDAIRMGFTMEDATKGLFDNQSALGMGAGSLEAYSAAQKLAIAGNATLGASVLGITKLTAAYSQENFTAEQIATGLFIAQQKGQTTVQDMAANIGKVSGIASDAGIKMAEMLAVTAQLTLVLPNTETAVTALKSVITSLTGATGEQARALELLEVPFGATQIKAAGLVKTFRAIRKATKENADVMNILIPDLRALQAITSLNDEALDKVVRNQELINKGMEDGAQYTAAYEARMKDINQQLAQARGEFQRVGAAIAEGLIPALKKSGGAAQGALEGVKIFPEGLFDIIPKTIEKLEDLRIARSPKGAERKWQRPDFQRDFAWLLGAADPLGAAAPSPEEFLRRKAAGEAHIPKFNRIPPSPVELATTTASSPGSTIENVTLKSSGTNLKTGINNLPGS